MAAPDPTPAELAQGQVVAGKFRLERLVGEGGVGSVWHATNTLTRSSVALKFLKTDDGLETTRRRLLREARAAAAVQHKNVRSVFDVIELADGSPVLVMEYLDGESLAERLRVQGLLSVAEATTVLAQVASGVGAAHAAGVVHRDLKPQNIFLVQGAFDQIKVVDFGIAKWRAADAGQPETLETASGAILGTPYYMSPEQIFGERGIDHRTDIWSAGLVLYECLTGRLPTRAENVGQVMKIIVAKPLPNIGEQRADLPADVVDLVTRMLARAPQNRPQSFAEVLDVLERHTASRVPRCAPPATPTTSEPRSAPEVEVAADIDLGHATVIGTEAPPPPPPPQRLSWRVFAAGGAAVLVASAAWLWSSGPRVAPSSVASTASASAVAMAAATSSAAPPPKASPSAPPEPTASASASSSAAKVSKSAAPRVSSAQPRASATVTPASATASAFSPSQRFE